MWKKSTNHYTTTWDSEFSLNKITHFKHYMLRMVNITNDAKRNFVEQWLRMEETASRYGK
jgi:hypothetical protein